MYLEIISLALDVLSFLAALVLAYKYVTLRHRKESDHYTDYVRGNLTLRVYKPEFEYQAIGTIPLEKILDRGTLSQFYLWALIEA